MIENKITRRVFLGTAAFFVSAPILASLPKTESSVGIKKILADGQFFNAHELTVLTDIAEIMIPKTHTPGATEAQVIPVLDALMLSWAGNDTKKRYRQLIIQVEKLAQDSYKKNYLESLQPERVSLLTVLDKRSFDNPNTDISINYRKLKELIFHVYYTSEEANPDYVLIPGTYKGCLSKQEYQNLVNKRLGRAS
ncbi:gluconate 2-dehydrogenase subunit 3 family protein [Glaciecola sp. KUL10]|uniref:gluconate 2-dehydrogenase subunit 3 family protein n=1 Tax=Glaciecola sp. (strain KUL10) TaxID=2161813 RepID=UPI000D785D2C|nr:gluconate 2-dehydrogenase subunit 3 family protein [Glaciecola sp. KUL10]GBL05347.1 hypothetical protein KUL10_26670 [Glaciecola sp. KUL10]